MLTLKRTPACPPPLPSLLSTRTRRGDIDDCCAAFRYCAKMATDATLRTLLDKAEVGALRTRPLGELADPAFSARVVYEPVRGDGRGAGAGPGPTLLFCTLHLSHFMPRSLFCSRLALWWPLRRGTFLR